MYRCRSCSYIGAKGMLTCPVCKSQDIVPCTTDTRAGEACIVLCKILGTTPTSQQGRDAKELINLLIGYP